MNRRARPEGAPSRRAHVLQRLNARHYTPSPGSFTFSPWLNGRYRVTQAWAAALARALRAAAIGDFRPPPAERTVTLGRTAMLVGARAALGARRFRLAVSLAARLLAALPTDAAGEAKAARVLVRDISRRMTEARNPFKYASSTCARGPRLICGSKHLESRI